MLSYVFGLKINIKNKRNIIYNINPKRKRKSYSGVYYDDF